MKKIKGKNAVITGASRGIGVYIAEALAARGVNLALVARPQSKELLGDIAERLSKNGVKAVAVPGDITVDSHRKEIVERSKAELGSVDIFVSNAAIESVASFLNQTQEIIVRSFAINVIAPMLLVKMILPDMIERGCGSIVTVSSLAGKIGSPYQASYSATKAGLIKWISAMQRELKDSGVKFSVVCPGYVSNVGMYADMINRDPGSFNVPWITGEVTPKQVAEGVVRAISKGLPDVIVAPGPNRLISALNELSPNILTSILGWTGITKFNEKLAQNS